MFLDVFGEFVLFCLVRCSVSYLLHSHNLDISWYIIYHQILIINNQIMIYHDISIIIIHHHSSSIIIFSLFSHNLTCLRLTAA
jgi:hypothetical protein